MSQITEEQIKSIGNVLKDPTRPLKERFRALFTLKNIGGQIAINCISETFQDESALLKHELAYCLGQMQDRNAVELLRKVLEDTKQEPMVRHEAAEALGAIGLDICQKYLEQYANDPLQEVRETCEIALDRIKWLKENNQSEECLSKNPYKSVDPAPPASSADVNVLTEILQSNDKSLFDRYKAMFALRNLRSKEAVVALGNALKYGSALFKHEIAFVLGQLQDPSSVPFLVDALCDQNENEMVRHECAEALGAIATQECLEILQKYLQDEKRVVRESCEVALDMSEYENSLEFQYANTLSVVKE